MNDIVIRRKGSLETDALQTLEKAARSRYGGLEGYGAATCADPISAQRFNTGITFVAKMGRDIVGFILLQKLDGMGYIANISVAPDLSGHGIGRQLMAVAEDHAVKLSLPALTLTTFKSPVWNAPWFTKCDYSPIPADKIGLQLREIMTRQAQFIDPTTRVTMWKPLNQN